MMARPREFCQEEALDQAMLVFWAKGYEATSLTELTRAMGISKSSFYDTFGSKHDLFLAAIERYSAEATERMVADLEGDGSAREAIAAVFWRTTDCADGDRRGCFMGNCAVEVSPHDPAAAARIAAGISRFERAFEKAVRRGQQGGEISSGHDARSLARYLVASLHGLQVMAKAKPDKEASEDVIRVVLAALD